MRGLLRHAFECGINLFDTAPNYAHTRSESVLGDALQGIGEQRGAETERRLADHQLQAHGAARHLRPRKRLRVAASGRPTTLE